MIHLPANWATATLNDITNVVRGVTFPASVKENSLTSTNVCCLRTTNIQREVEWENIYFIPRSYVKREEQFVRPGDVLMSMANSYALVGKVAIANAVPYPTAFGAFLSAIRPTSIVDGKYLFYLLRTNSVQSELRKGSSQTTNIANISVSKLSNINIPLAPLNEQKRIADKLDGVLARVDACRDRLDRIPAILKRFRKSVLAAAISGKLTEEWRAELEVSISVWESTTFEAESKEITVGYVGKMSSEYRNSGVPFLRSLNVRPFRFDSRELRFISLEFHQRIRKSALKPGDVVVVRTGAPGQCCVIPIDLPQANCSDLVVVRPGPKLLAAFACLYINSELSQAFVRSEQVGVAQLHFNVGSMKRAPLALPSIEEQTEIIRRVSALFAYADRLEGCYTTARAKVEKLRPCLLAKAFRGELVPQDPNDEPAAELFGRIAGKSALALHRKHARKTRQSAQGSAMKINILPKEVDSIKKQPLATLEDIASNHLANILLATKRGEAKALWAASGLSIDAFYVQLRREISAGLLRVSADDESQLESATSDDSTV